MTVLTMLERVMNRPKKNDPSDRRCALAGEEVNGRKVECTPLAPLDPHNESWCFGCGYYICEAHEAGSTGAFGSHEPTAHLGD